MISSALRGRWQDCAWQGVGQLPVLQRSSVKELADGSKLVNCTLRRNHYRNA